MLCIGITHYYKDSNRLITISGIVIVTLLNIINYYKKEEGKIYLNSKSITLRILLHLLVNWV